MRRVVLAGFAALAVAAPAPIHAQEVAARVHGVVVDEDGRPVANARVELEGTTWAAMSDERGRYLLLGVRPGEYRVRVSVVGYAADARTVTVARGESRRLDLRLRPTAFALDPIVVTGTKKATFVSESPVKVDVVTAGHLERSGAKDLMESLQTVNGLYQQVECGVCYTNSIRINGMEGPYTAVLIDGMPIMGALASVYGLNGISTAVIERLEIIKGPSSTLYGSEAMGGVVNVITKDPRFTPRYAVDASATGYGETNIEASVSPKGGRVSGLLSGQLRHMDDFVDENGDGFTDLTQMRQASLFGKMTLGRGDDRRLDVVGKYYRESRFGGVEEWTSELRGSDSVYGESIETERAEVLGSWAPRFVDDVRVEFSYSRHEQDSYYGDLRYAAVQDIAFANLLWDVRLGSRHDLLAGATVRHQTYDDNTPATPRTDRDLIPGVFVQDEVIVASRLSVLGGMRLDHHEEHGAIPSPRASLKWEPVEGGTVRLNAGTGFRVVNLFAEDHAALTGSRDVVIADELEPERSYSAALNLNQVLEFGPSPMMIDLDLFYTHFTNRIIPDYDADPNAIVYENLDGHGVTRGVAFALNQNVLYNRFLYTLGITFQDVYTVEADRREREFFAPDFKGVFSLTYNVPEPALSIDYNGSVTGSMRLPEYEPPHRRATESPVFSVHNVRLGWEAADGFEIYGAVRNLFDFTQRSPLIAPDDPFGEAFDTNYVYGPVFGRSFRFGVRYAASR